MWSEPQQYKKRSKSDKRPMWSEPQQYKKRSKSDKRPMCSEPQQYKKRSKSDKRPMWSEAQQYKERSKSDKRLCGVNHNSTRSAPNQTSAIYNVLALNEDLLYTKTVTRFIDTNLRNIG